MVVLICFSIGVGVGCGVAIATLIWLRRRDQVIDSLIQLEQLVGHAGTVEMPFDHHSQGKVRVDINGSALNLRAFTDDVQGFKLGDRVVVMATQGDRVWVVSEQTFKT
ncbi:hypothetical protein C1752_06374 [Acaryochloris thomasi RCC1774]|uniref:Uncharacterized protein n=1 Tax=Acaryochloris thomasi RCC1774 TaxID=1764569 RepID=A0A2W1JBQ8_9CYAN|nr:NfeD family protein [Acaryochloris thomasi]PZD71483.1 hypothetical protein C1752_06374 [Acaryochloris thomasi RCC1774]